MKSQLVWCSIGFVCWASVAQAQRTVTVTGLEDEVFHSLQKAIDAAPPGAIINLSAGRFNERVTIKKSVSLVGAGADVTIIGPTEEEQIKLWNEALLSQKLVDDVERAAEDANPRKQLTEADAEHLKKNYEKMHRLVALCLQPTLLVEGANQVEIHSLRITMPLTPQEDSGLQVTAAVQINNSAVKMKKCAVVGCMSDGVDVSGDSQLDIDDCLIAACWGTGVSASNPNNANVHIARSDIRNNYHYNIGLGVDICVIEDCRISGTAWGGVSCGANTVQVLRNVIFNNSRGIYSVGKQGIVKHNVFYQNNAAVSCWSSDQPIYEENIFLENSIGTANVNGPGEPKFRNNIFVNSPSGVRYGPMKITKGEKPPTTNFHLEGNVFWQIEKPAVLRRSHEDHSQDEPIAILENRDNHVANPNVAFNNEKQLVIGNGNVISKSGLKELQSLSLDSQWKITPEEKAMIPDDGTVESSKWKKRPKR